MVATYTVFGRQVGSHVLAMITLGTTFAGSWYAMRGDPKKAQQKTPPINAGSSDEEKFVKDFLQSNEASKTKAATH